MAKIVCSICGDELDENQFYKKASSPTGRQRECKSCHGRKNAKYQPKAKAATAEEPATPTGQQTRAKWLKHESTRREMLADAGTRIAADTLITPSSRALTLTLALILEQQLRLFGAVKMPNPSPFDTSRANSVLEETLFAIKAEIKRHWDRTHRVWKHAEATGAAGLPESADREQERAAALETLGLGPDADFMTIRSAYREKAQQAHPDRGGTQEAMQALNEAYAILMES